MALKLKDFARTNIESDPIRRSDESEDEDISYLPTPSSGSAKRRRSDSGRRESSNRGDSSSPPRSEHVPKRERDEKPLLGPPGADGSIKVKYASEIDGYGVDNKALAQMESLGLPTGFSFNQATPAMGPVSEKQKKGDKKTFYCQICLIELNSLDTMKSHVSGVKHMKKKLQLEQQREEQRRNGELADEERAPTVIPIPNPENTKKKVPVRLHERIKETRDPVVGLDYVKEFIAVSDPEMEPHYECELCGSKGIANGMFSHIMGFKHRQEFVRKIHENTPDAERMMDLSQRELLEIARKYSENKDDLNAKIRCRRSDEEYPWPSGKAPWSIERGGTGIPPDRARENWGRNRDFSDHKPVILNMDRKPAEASGHQRSGGLPAPGEVRVPRTQAEAVRMLELSQRLMQVGCQFLGPSLSDEEKTLLTTLSNSVMTKIMTKRQITPLASPSNGHSSHHQNGHHSPTRPRSSFSSRSKSPSRRRPRNSRSPSPSPRPGPSNGQSHQQNGPPIKRERTEYRDRTQRSSSSYYEDKRREEYPDDRRRGGDHHHEDRRRTDDYRSDQDRRASSSHREDWGGGRDYFERRESSNGRYPPSSNGRRY